VIKLWGVQRKFVCTNVLLIQYSAVTNHKEAHCIFPNVYCYPLCSTRVLPPSCYPDFDNSCWHRLHFHQDTCCLGWNRVGTETATPRPGIAYRSLLLMCGRRTDVHSVSGCSLHHLNNLSRPLGCNPPTKNVCFTKFKLVIDFGPVHKQFSDDTIIDFQSRIRLLCTKTDILR